MNQRETLEYALLRDQISKLSKSLNAQDAELDKKDKLITELCDALQNGLLVTDGVKEARMKYRRDQALIQRAREATR